jgi:hypothetical protein
MSSPQMTRMFGLLLPFGDFAICWFLCVDGLVQ